MKTLCQQILERCCMISHSLMTKKSEDVRRNGWSSAVRTSWRCCLLPESCFMEVGLIRKERQAGSSKKRWVIIGSSAGRAKPQLSSGIFRSRNSFETPKIKMPLPREFQDLMTILYNRRQTMQRRAWKTFTIEIINRSGESSVRPLDFIRKNGSLRWTHSARYPHTALSACLLGSCSLGDFAKSPSSKAM